MQFIDDVGKVWHKLWSVRLSIAAGLVSAADAGWEVYVTGQPPYRALLTAGISFGAAAARIVAQPKTREPSDG